jgi:hypothetical protein
VSREGIDKTLLILFFASFLMRCFDLQAFSSSHEEQTTIFSQDMAVPYALCHMIPRPIQPDFSQGLHFEQVTLQKLSLFCS